MKPRFKTGDFIFWQDKVSADITIAKIIKVDGTLYTYNTIKPWIVNKIQICHSELENETDYETRAELVDDEQKLELL